MLLDATKKRIDSCIAAKFYGCISSTPSPLFSRPSSAREPLETMPCAPDIGAESPFARSSSAGNCVVSVASTAEKRESTVRRDLSVSFAASASKNLERERFLSPFDVSFSTRSFVSGGSKVQPSFLQIGSSSSGVAGLDTTEPYARAVVNAERSLFGFGQVSGNDGSTFAAASSSDGNAATEKRRKREATVTKRYKLKRPVQCRYCERIFWSHTGRYYHEANHTGKWLFYCGRCDAGFMQRKAFGSHMKIKHGVQQNEEN